MFGLFPLGSLSLPDSKQFHVRLSRQTYFLSDTIQFLREKYPSRNEYLNKFSSPLLFNKINLFTPLLAQGALNSMQEKRYSRNVRQNQCLFVVSDLCIPLNINTHYS